ncbi:MAG: type IV pilin protein [Polaromonas sp.]|nr:type IV pilin protein [Polaromonas sp.]
MTFKSSARARGFTLIELLVSVTIVAMLAAIALPSYASYVARARRADAKGQLVQAAQFMQRFYSANDSFSADRAGNDVTGQVPASLRQSPSDSARLYELVIPMGAAPLTSPMGFTLRMVPVAGGSMALDLCGAFTLTSTGVRGVLVDGVPDTGALRDSCWK